MIVKSVLVCLFVGALLAAGVDGRWLFKFDTPVGERKGVWEITSDGENLTAKASGQTYNGWFREGKLHLSATIHSVEGDITDELKIDGQLQDDRIVGTAEFGGYTMKFVASRPE